MRSIDCSMFHYSKINVLLTVAAWGPSVVWSSRNGSCGWKGIRVFVEEVGVATALSFFNHLVHERVVDTDYVLEVLQGREDRS